MSTIGPDAMQALIDQAEAGMRDTARLTLAFWSTLVAGGMPTYEAAVVCGHFVSALIAASIIKGS